MFWLAGLWRGFILSLCLALVSIQAHAEGRLALVIGNDAYVDLPPLQKAVNDARAVGAALEEVGFRVLRGENLDRRAINRLLAEFELAIQPGDQAFVFFAGHGVAIRSENIILPTDMPKPRAGDENFIRSEGYVVDDLVARIQAKGTSIAVFVIDACRDNPLIVPGGRSIGDKRGLIRPDAPQGVLLLHSASPGQAALDRLSDVDPNPHSVFTRRLVPLLREPGLGHLTLAKRLQTDVRQLALSIGHNQFPDYVDRVVGEIVLNAAPSAIAPQQLATKPVEMKLPSERVQPSTIRESPAADQNAVSPMANLPLGQPQPSAAGSTMPPDTGQQTPAGLLRTFEGHQSYIASVAFSPDGRRVLSGSHDKTLRLWDITTGRLLRSIEAHRTAVDSVAFSPDGKRLLSGGDKTPRLWDAETGALLRTFVGHQSSVTSVAFSPDGQSVLSGGWDKTLRLWDANTGRLLRTFQGHEGWVKSVAFSPDGQRVLSGSSDRTLRLWSTNTGQALFIFEGHEAEVRSVAFSPDGQRVLSGGDRTPRLWDVSTGQLVRTFGGPERAALSVAFSPDGQRVLAGSFDKTLRIWDANSGRLLIALQGPEVHVNSVAFSSDGQHVLSGSWGAPSGPRGNTVRLWDAGPGAVLTTR